MTERRIISFDQFSHKGKIVKEDTLLPPEAGAGHDSEDHGDHEDNGGGHYMFFKNLLTIKHYVDEMLKMNPDQIENLLKNGHDWASDHIATAKDDIQEVTDWARGEIEMGGHGAEDVPMDLEPDGEIEVDIDSDDMEDDDDDMDAEEVEVEEEPEEASVEDEPEDEEEEPEEDEDDEDDEDEEEGEEVAINSDGEEEEPEEDEEEEIEIEAPEEEERRNEND